MENAADALKMAAAVLIFVLALSISINAFGEARLAATTVLEYRDREYDYNYYYHVEDNGTTQRMVGVETIVPSMYKAYKENYKIVFDSNTIRSLGGLYQKKNEEGNPYAIYKIDLEEEVLGSDAQKDQFIMAILYGRDADNYYKNKYGDTVTFNEIKRRFSTNLGIYLNDTGIYGKIKEKKFKENLGVYYQEETKDGTGSDTPEANKTKKRVITYTEE